MVVHGVVGLGMFAAGRRKPSASGDVFALLFLRFQKKVEMKKRRMENMQEKHTARLKGAPLPEGFNAGGGRCGGGGDAMQCSMTPPEVR